MKKEMIMNDWPCRGCKYNDRKMTEEPCRTCRWNLADNRLSEEHGDNRVHVKIKGTSKNTYDKAWI